MVLVLNSQVISNYVTRQRIGHEGRKGKGGYTNGATGKAMAERDLSPLSLQIVRGLNDKLYEKRKTAALEIER